MKVFWLITLLGLIGVPRAFADDNFRTAVEVINSEGSLTISDGSSNYSFMKDGTFTSGPRGISGRTMKGTWRAPEGDGLKTVKFLIDVQIGWMNGIQSPHDFRTITMFVYPGFRRDKPREGTPPGNDSGQVYKCYFIIDEMKKK